MSTITKMVSTLANEEVKMGYHYHSAESQAVMNKAQGKEVTIQTRMVEMVRQMKTMNAKESLEYLHDLKNWFYTRLCVAHKAKSDESIERMRDLITAATNLEALVSHKVISAIAK